jgi:lipopolysaccharide transport system permease protein
MKSQVESNEEQWDLLIEPKVHLLQLNLHEVWRYKYLLWMFVKRDLVSVYKQTILGPLWFFIQPILTTLIYVIVFGKIAKISTDGLPPILFYLSGITTWNYFAETLNSTSNTFINNAGISEKYIFPGWLCLYQRYFQA